MEGIEGKRSNGMEGKILEWNVMSLHGMEGNIMKRRGME